MQSITTKATTSIKIKSLCAKRNPRTVLSMPCHEMDAYVDSLFYPHDKYFLTLQQFSCSHVLCAVTIPLVLFSLFICYLIIYLGEPTYVNEMFVDGFTRTEYGLCPNDGMGTKLVILVASAPGHLEKRLAIRHSWGTFASREDVTVAFVLGQPLGNYTAAVEFEEKVYKDIIVGNSLDLYHYLSLKTLAMLKWVQKHCSHAKYVMKTDDDTFLNVPAWLAIADISTTRTVWSANIRYNDWIVRRKESKYYVPHREFHNEKLPTYAFGAGYMMSSDCVALLLEGAFKSPYLGLEDVLLTGVIAPKVGISIRSVFQEHQSRQFDKFIVHKIQATDQYVIWKVFTSLKGKVMSLREIEKLARVIRQYT